MDILVSLLLISFVGCGTSSKDQPPDQLSGRNSSLIIRGRPTEIRDYSFAVFIRIYLGEQMEQCGGAALSILMVLTAAHCLNGRPAPADILIIVGVTNITQAPPGGIINIFRVISYMQHPYYNRRINANDVGLVGTTINSHGLEFSHAVLSTEEDPTPAPPLSVTALGWGLDSIHARHPSDTLRAVTIPVVDRYLCDNIVFRERRTHITSDAFGAGDLGRDTRNTCYGDSGGPLIDSDRVVVGVISGGLNCRPNGINLPSVHVSVARVRRWIHTIVGF